jgi:N-acyl homoserine lactone hydrolase
VPIDVEVLELGTVDLPDSHPRASDAVALVRSFLIRHPDGLILFDTGCGDDHPLINELYSPNVTSVVVALNDIGVDERDITAIVNSHLHFDHCGQNRLFAKTPVWVQRAELDAARQPNFTVPEWAELSTDRQRMLDGDETIASGVTILATPGHTPGHQSLLIESGGGRELIVGQACYTCADFAAGEVAIEDMHDESWLRTGRESLARLRAIGFDVARFSHDVAVCQGL